MHQWHGFPIAKNNTAVFEYFYHDYIYHDYTYHDGFRHRKKKVLSLVLYHEMSYKATTITFTFYTLLIQKIHTHTNITLHTDYIHDKYNIYLVKYKHTHTHKSNYHLHCNT